MCAATPPLLWKELGVGLLLGGAQVEGLPCLPQVLSAATIVAKHTSALCNTCRLASSRTANPVAKRQFVQSAKEVANSTANLVKTIKVLSDSQLGRRYQ